MSNQAQANHIKIVTSFGLAGLSNDFLPAHEVQTTCEGLESTVIRLQAKIASVVAWYEARPCLDLTQGLTIDDLDDCHGIIDNNIAATLGYQATVKPITKEQAVIRPATINA